MNQPIDQYLGFGTKYSIEMCDSVLAYCTLIVYTSITTAKKDWFVTIYY